MRYLIQRPVAVLMTTLALLIFSLLAIRELPVSLLPPTEIPEIVVKVNLSNASPEAVERNALAPLRNALQTLPSLSSMESQAGSETGDIRLRFEFGIAMDLVFIEINEKIDRIVGQLPAEMERPLVIRLSASDIPVVRLHMVPQEDVNFAEVSDLAKNVVRKRLEQLEGISLVDINGARSNNIVVQPDPAALRRHNLDEKSLITTIENANRELGGVSVKDGQYRYFLKMANRLQREDDILQLPVQISDSAGFIPMRNLATVRLEQERPKGKHLYNNEEALVLNIHKQANARMNAIMPELYAATALFQQDYPGVQFALSQDQSALLDTSIDNLSSSLYMGGIFALAILFIFIGNYRTPLIMAVSLPVSLLISFLLFQLFNVSINIISLSGLALGVGMLIDNSIIVLDNISRKRGEGLGLMDACVEGVNEIMSALVSSVLTTLAVFVPLIYLSGVAGALFFDQAVAVAVILGVSLLVAFILLPLLYLLMFQRYTKTVQQDSRLYLRMERLYNRLFQRVFKRPAVAFFLLILLIPLAGMLGYSLPISGMPPVKKLDLQLQIDWNEAVSIEEHTRRLQKLFAASPVLPRQFDIDFGLSQYLLQSDDNAAQQSAAYILFDNASEMSAYVTFLDTFFASNYPAASFQQKPAANAFDQLFSNDEPYFKLKWRMQQATDAGPELQVLHTALEDFPIKTWDFSDNLHANTALSLQPRYAMMNRYGVSFEDLMDKVEKLFGEYTITNITGLNREMPVRLDMATADIRHALSSNTIRGKNNQKYTLAEFIDLSFTEQPKYISADRSGQYYSITFDEQTEVEALQASAMEWSQQHGFLADIGGQYFADRETIQQLAFILVVAVALLYFILAAQFENFMQPFIVVTTLPLGIGGAFLLLLLTGQSLNVMSGIGLVVMLGIIVNDAILKIDIINRNFKANIVKRVPRRTALMDALHTGGKLRLKPIVMTSLTTMLALAPLLFFSGLGAELQRPLVISVLGGLTIGTLSSLFYVPLAYFFMMKKGPAV